MKAIMARASLDSSSSKRNFKWINRRSNGVGGCCGEGGEGDSTRKQFKEEDFEEAQPSSKSSSLHTIETAAAAPAKKRSSVAAVAVSRFRSVVMAALVTSRHGRSNSLGSRIIGTLYGHRRGHVHLAFQVQSKSCPVVLLELATPTSNLVREMSSGMMRIALECQRKIWSTKTKDSRKLLDEPLWQAYCNGRKCGYAIKRECGPEDWKVLKAVEPVSMGAGVLPKEGGVATSGSGEGAHGEMMYMRARFERVVGSRDSEAFYMMNPDGNGGTELSIYFLRV